jgi:integrase
VATIQTATNASGLKRYAVRWWEGPGRQRKRTFARFEDARRYRSEIERSQDVGEYRPPELAKTPFGAYWLEFLAGSQIRPSTRARYFVHHRLYLDQAFGRRPLGAITTRDIRAWRVNLQTAGVGAATVNAATQLLKAVLNRAVTDGMIPSSPAKHVANPSTDPAGGLRVLEALELARLAEAHPDRYRALVWLLGVRGLRIGEAVALRVGDLDFLRGTCSITKTLTDVGGTLIEGPPKTASSNRTVSLPPFLRDMLTEHVAAFSDPKDPAAYVFTGPNGAPIRANNLRRRAFGPAVREAGLDENLTPHDLRDTAATLAFANGATVKEVSLMLGHRNASVTLNRYTGSLTSQEARTDKALDTMYRNVNGVVK